MRRLDGKVAIITGGAGGIGRAAGALFVGEGASVLLVDQPGSGVEGAAREIGGAVAAFAADVTDSLQVDAYMREALDQLWRRGHRTPERRHRRCAHAARGISARGLREGLSGQRRRRVAGLRAAIQPLRRGGGSVVITSSIQGSSALPYTSAYTTSKHAVMGMMKGAALELAKDNIRVNCIVPGMTDTPMMDRIHESSGAPEQMAATVRATIPMRRYARPEEIARLMLFLASQESSYCTGSTYAADGGILASWTSPPD